jgi:hypothetical protein
MVDLRELFDLLAHLGDIVVDISNCSIDTSLNDHLELIMMLVIAQVVGWENPNPTTKMARTMEHYTQCHLDVGPALQG